MSKFKPRGFFITGTDTDIGKTYISKLLVDHLTTSLNVKYMKPVQTGCYYNNEGVLQSPDLDFVISDKKDKFNNLDLHVPYRFQTACSPHLAATLESKVISIDYIRECFNHISNHSTVTIVEGAGGLLAPLGENIFMLDLIKHLQLPAIVVTAPQLGTLNHTFLTLKLLKQSNIELAGVVLNNCRDIPEDFIYHDNRKMIREFIRPAPFLEVPYEKKDNECIKGFCNQLEQYI